MRNHRCRWFPVCADDYLIFIEGVIEGEEMIFDVFGDSIYFVFWLVDFYLRVGAGDGIDFSVLLFFFEDRPFSDAYC